KAPPGIRRRRAWQIFRAIPTVSSSQALFPRPVPPGVAMDALPPLSPEALTEALRGRFEDVCKGIAPAVNQAPPGRVINQGEEKARDLFAGLRREAFRTALQMKVDAAEAAFPPPKAPDGRRLKNKGREPPSVLTANGRIDLARTRW